MTKIGIYPGSFDPITLGHLDIIQRSLHVVDKLIIAVSNNKSKKHMISIDDRLDLINKSILSLPNDVQSKINIEKLGVILKEDGFFARPISTSNKSLNLSSILKKFRNKSIPIEYTFCDGWLIEPLVKEKRNLWIYGAGHVGTAIANTIDKLERFNIFCLDTSEERYPHDFPKNVERLIAVNPAELVKYAPGDTHHLILTYSHALDLEVCNQLLKQPFLSAGLIGSKTKWVRFKKRLGELGYKSEQIYRIVCPIGDPSLGKSPYEIAIGVANMLLDYDKIHASRKEALSM